jgi:hypothetical protein
LCAHKLDVAIFTASEKFIDRFAVVVDEDRFAVVVDEDRFAVVAETDRIAVVADDAAVAGWSMDKVAWGRWPHPNIRSNQRRNYRKRSPRGEQKQKGRPDLLGTPRKLP